LEGVVHVPHDQIKTLTTEDFVCPVSVGSKMDEASPHLMHIRPFEPPMARLANHATEGKPCSLKGLAQTEIKRHFRRIMVQVEQQVFRRRIVNDEAVVAVESAALGRIQQGCDGLDH
jgi:hypothetical protein